MKSGVSIAQQNSHHNDLRPYTVAKTIKGIYWRTEVSMTKDESSSKETWKSNGLVLIFIVTSDSFLISFLIGFSVFSE